MRYIINTKGDPIITLVSEEIDLGNKDWDETHDFIWDQQTNMIFRNYTQLESYFSKKNNSLILILIITSLTLFILFIYLFFHYIYLYLVAYFLISGISSYFYFFQIREYSNTKKSVLGAISLLLPFFVIPMNFLFFQKIFKIYLKIY